MNILFPKHRRPVLDLVVIFAVDPREDIGRRVEFRVRERLEDGVCGEEVVWVVVGDEDGFQGFVGCFSDPGSDGFAVGFEEGGVDEDGFGGAYD
jgi:hypothetical protein